MTTIETAPRLHEFRRGTGPIRGADPAAPIELHLLRESLRRAWVPVEAEVPDIEAAWPVRCSACGPIPDTEVSEIQAVDGETVRWACPRCQRPFDELTVSGLEAGCSGPLLLWGVCSGYAAAGEAAYWAHTMIGLPLIGRGDQTRFVWVPRSAAPVVAAEAYAAGGGGLYVQLVDRVRLDDGREVWRRGMAVTDWGDPDRARVAKWLDS